MAKSFFVLLSLQASKINYNKIKRKLPVDKYMNFGINANFVVYTINASSLKSSVGLFDYASTNTFF